MKFVLETVNRFIHWGHMSDEMVAEADGYEYLDDQIKEWLGENITSNYYTIKLETITGQTHNCQLIIEFTDETDAMAFKLRWT